ncbi:Dynein light chain 4, axonemal [Clydaea vesicula]|uniref:Dynein light chain n=1 Tax=Clydaea vesicula TaxID=447962 RepID=A0AAD5TZE3_9FUNG|nr:Dynein light chain 4, axonemal [Clydaea vesicula]KAJ3396132.1 Dynein light chain 4, axonemal [Lobulomyces angularis]
MATLGSTNNLAGGPPDAAAGAGGASADAKEGDSRRNFNYPLVKICDMVDELRLEAVDMVVTAVEKHPGNYEAAAKNIKEAMDKRCGSSWHVIVGEGFGFQMTYEQKNLLFMYFGALGIIVWKAS